MRNQENAKFVISKNAKSDISKNNVPRGTQKRKNMEFGLKVKELNAHMTLIKDTDWEGRTVYYIGCLSKGKTETGKAFHRVKISKRDYEKLEKVSEQNESWIQKTDSEQSPTT